MHALACLCLLVAPLAAQAGAKGEELAARRAAKLERPAFAAAGFTTDLEAALARARETGRPVFAYFTRSYAH